MNHPSHLLLIPCALFSLSSAATAQVPDLLNALDAGGRAMGLGGANNATNVDTLSAFYNPAALAYLDTGAAGSRLPQSAEVPIDSERLARFAALRHGRAAWRR